MTRNKFGFLLLAAVSSFAQPVQRVQPSLPVFFIPNAGQTHPSVRYMVHTPGLNAGFTPVSAVFQLDRMSLRVDFEDANPEVAIEGLDRLGGNANFLIGNQEQNWKTDLPTYQKILYRNLYPGIDMTYGGIGHRIKSEFMVNPGADPARIRLRYSGADHISIEPNGDLLIRGRQTEAREEAPVIFQKGAQIPGQYRLLDADTVGFILGDYDPSQPLLIDPTLTYATYLGGTGMSAVTALAVDSSGDLYATGWTESLNFQIAGPIQASNAGGVDVFVVKLNPAGTSLLYATYIGGSATDKGAGIAVDSSGAAYVAGSTSSSNFPLVSAADSKLGGGQDAFALKINAVGNLLVYSTYLGGTGADYGYAIAVDSSGDAYIAGDTMSANFPITSGVAQTKFGGNQNVFITKLNPSGAIAYSTFLGGSGVDHTGAIALDSSNNAYIAGGTTSTNFPTVGAIRSSNGGYQDAFLTKLNSAGTAFVYSTYLGGNGGATGTPEQATGVAVDSSGNAYITGVTDSTNFPVTAGAFQTVLAAIEDGFVAKVNPAGSALVYCSLLGGSASNYTTGIAVASGGVAYVSGYTSSSDFPVVNATQALFGGMYDAFVSVFNSTGSSLSFSTYFGGSGSDSANAIAIDSSGNMYVGGQTNSANLPTNNAIQPSNPGNAIAWLARLGVTTVQQQQLPQVLGVTPTSGSGNSATFTAQFSDAAGISALATTTVLVNTTASSNYGCQVSYSIATNQFALANDVASSGSSLVNPGGGNGQNGQCTLNGSGSYITKAGNTLTMVISLTFQPGFTGNDTVYLSAIDTSNNNTGQVAAGMWTATVPPPQPTASSVSPNSGLGSSQTFTFVFSDTQNANNITGMGMVFNSSLSFTQACYIIVDTNAGTVALAYDNDSGSNSKAISSSATLANSQCTVGATTLTVSGLSQILTVAVTFNGAFSGAKNIYMYGSENGVYTTGWVQMGTYTVAAGGVPVANGVAPSTGTGPTNRFSFTVSDAGGSSFITGLTGLVNSSLSTTQACYIVYDRTSNTISLAYDNPSNGASPVTPGSSSVVSNSQCTLKASDSTVTIGTTSVSVTVDLMFNANYYGAKNIYLDAIEPGFTSGWVTVGTWTVTGGAPVANSVSPASGSGASQTFTFTVSDSTNYANISGMSMLFTTGAPTNLANACYLTYNVAAGTISLYNNAGTSSSSKTIGSSSNLSNSQCAVGYTVGYPSGNSVVFQINLTFSGSFNTPQSVYLNALEPNTSSGWVSVGGWTP